MKLINRDLFLFYTNRSAPGGEYVPEWSDLHHMICYNRMDSWAKFRDVMEKIRMALEARRWFMS